MGAIHFGQIHPRAFAHPADGRATSAFEQLPVLPDLLKKISHYGVEEKFLSHHMYNSVKLGPTQLASIWHLVHDVAERLGIPTPTTYLSRQGEANAFAFGRQTPSIVLTSELVELMSERELQGIIAHEMGHILCQHMLYMGVGVALSSGALPGLAKLIPGLEETVAGLFFAWFRAAEYSADRAALLILEDPEPLTQSLCRLAGVPRRYESEFDLGQFIGQANDFEESASLWSKLLTFGRGLFLTHPEPAKRVGAILEWAASEEYREILEGDYLTRFEADALAQPQIDGVRSCPLCRRPVGAAEVCSYCSLPQDRRYQQSCPRKRRPHPAALEWRFCKACGNALKPDARGSEIPGH